PTVANSVMASVPQDEAGGASGTNSSLRELGGVFGVAVLAAIFSRHGVYAPPKTFVDGFQPAPLVRAAVTAVRAAPRPPPPRASAPGKGAQLRPVRLRARNGVRLITRESRATRRGPWRNASGPRRR